MNILNNVSLWFAKDQEGTIITIDKINEEYKGKYYCPLCGSEVIPKAINSKQVSPHFAHLNREACSGESVVHWWVKNELIKIDDVIEITTDKTKQIMCKKVEFEKSYETPYGKYIPDISIETYDGEVIFIEVNFTNKKKIDEIYSKWKSLEKTVIEFNVKSVYDEASNKISITNSYKAIYYNGKEFEIDKESKDYKAFKRSVTKFNGKREEELISDIDWFFDDVYKYYKKELEIEKILYGFEYILNKNEYKDIIIRMYKNKCSNVIKDIINYKDISINRCFQFIKDKYGIKSSFTTSSDEKRIKDKIFKDYYISVLKQDICNCTFLSYDEDKYETVFIDSFDKDVISYIDNKLGNIIEQYKQIESICELVYTVVKTFNKRTIPECVYKGDYIKITFGRRGYYVDNRHMIKIWKDGTISLNGVNLLQTDIYNEDKLIKDLQFCLNYSIPGGNMLLDRNVIDLYEKIHSRYTKDTSKCYSVEITNEELIIGDCFKTIATFKYNNNTTFEEVIEVFSKAVREYIYGNKEE